MVRIALLAFIGLVAALPVADIKPGNEVVKGNFEILTEIIRLAERDVNAIKAERPFGRPPGDPESRRREERISRERQDRQREDQRRREEQRRREREQRDRERQRGSGGGHHP